MSDLSDNIILEGDVYKSGEPLKNYFTYFIKNDEGKYYIGISNSNNHYYNPLRWFLSENKKNPEAYKNISASIKKHSYKGHVLRKRDHGLTKKEAEEKIYEFGLKLQEKGLLINSKLINPERYNCRGCGMEIKKIFEQQHNEKYCSALLDDELDRLLG